MDLVRLMEVTGAVGSFVTFVNLVYLRGQLDPALNPQRYRALGFNIAFVIVFYVGLILDVVGSSWLRQYRKTYPERTPPSRRYSARRIQVSWRGSGLSLAFW